MTQSTYLNHHSLKRHPRWKFWMIEKFKRFIFPKPKLPESIGKQAFATNQKHV